jgi:hypothetical protein
MPNQHSLGFPGAVYINKVSLAMWAKFRFGLAQVIPGESWLRKVHIEQSFGFLTFVQASLIGVSS